MTPSPKTAIDWLRFRTQATPVAGLRALRPLFGDLGEHLTLQAPQRGLMGFQQGRPLAIGDLVLGRVDFGGDSQRGWSRWDIPGSGCEWVRDWDAIEEVERLPEAELRRTDIALTTWHGEVNHDRVVDAHAAGRFITRGRPPDMQTILNTNPAAGRTCNIGRREGSEKYFRGYEKGLKWAAESVRNVTHIDGSAVEDIYRCEVELKVRDRPIPWEVIERRDQYFAGAYPFCADVLPGIEADILKGRPERRAQVELAAALENCRVQYGAVLFTALHAYEGDIGAVWDRIVGEKHHRGLLEAGVLMVDHFEQGS